MKKIKVLFLVTTIISLGCICPLPPDILPRALGTQTSLPTLETSSAPTEIRTFPAFLSPFSFDWGDRNPFRSNLRPEYLEILDELTGVSVYHMSLNILPSLTIIEGIEEILYTNTEAVALDELVLAIFPKLLGGDLSITSVSLDGEAVDPFLEDWLVRIPFPHPLLPGMSAKVHLTFSVETPSGGSEQYYGIFGYDEGILSLAHAYPTVLVYNEEGWNMQKPDLDGDPLFSDISFYLVSVEAPSDLVIAASGMEIDKSIIGDRQVVLFANGPARDFYLAASDDWLGTSKESDGIVFTVFGDPHVGASLTGIVDYGISSVNIFNHRYGPYPYTELEFVPIVTSAGGIEFPGIIALSDDIFSWDDFTEIVVAHEVAHMWFYNLVGNDTLDQPWLDESISQFSTWQFLFDKYGNERAQSFSQLELQSFWESAIDPSQPIGLPVNAYPGNDYAAIVYGRGPFFLLELREQMSPAIFDTFMRQYTDQFSWQIASTEDFRRLAEESCNCDLQVLFHEWIYP